MSEREYAACHSANPSRTKSGKSVGSSAKFGRGSVSRTAAGGTNVYPMIKLRGYYSEVLAEDAEHHLGVSNSDCVIL